MSKMETRGPHKATLLDALSVVLQHPAVAADQQNICKLVQVSKACRTAVQQSTACLTEVVYDPQPPCLYRGLLRTQPPYRNKTPADIADWAAKIALFAHWLFTYAGTVRSISLGSPNSNIDPGAYRSLCIHAEHIIPLSLRSIAALQQCQTGASTGTSISFEVAAVLPQPLGLQRFSCWHMFASPLLVSALPVATLTQLQVYSSRPDAVHLQEAIGNLSNLRSLHLECSPAPPCWPDSYLSSISKLSKLTSLCLRPLQSPNALALWPRQLIELDLRLYPITPGQPTAASVVLSHLTQLQQLRLKYSRPLSDSRLPQQLRTLYVNQFYNEGSAIAALHITSLQQLQVLHINRSNDSPEELMSLSQIQQLERLDLEYLDNTIAVAAATTWPQLKQLVGLHLDLTCTSCTAVQMATIVEAIGSCTRLTSLSFACDEVTYDEDEPLVYQAAFNRLHRTCEAFQSLTHLRELRMWGAGWEPPDSDADATDFSHLSALTGLTLLELVLGQAHLEDAVMIAVLLKLTQLQDLSLPLLNSIGPFPVIGELKGLTSLSLTGLALANDEEGVQDVQEQGLTYLTGLKKLRVLDGFEDCDEEVLEKFWSDLRGNA